MGRIATEFLRRTRGAGSLRDYSRPLCHAFKTGTSFVMPWGPLALGAVVEDVYVAVTGSTPGTTVLTEVVSHLGEINIDNFDMGRDLITRPGTANYRFILGAEGFSYLVPLAFRIVSGDRYLAVRITATVGTASGLVSLR